MKPYACTRPLDGAVPLLLASPHCGTHVPEPVRRQLAVPPALLRRIEDAHVAELLRPAALAHGVPLIAATHSRAVIDLNRSPGEYDPAMVAGRLPIAPEPSARVQRGYGLIPRLAGGPVAIHRGPLAAADVMDRIERLHAPWHEALACGLARARARHGRALLLDCHSMPSLDRVTAAGDPPDVVLGDLGGRSADPGLVARLGALFEDAGLKVALNRPYAGGHTLARHGRPAAGIDAIQLELDRALYMDPQTLALTAGAARLSALLGEAVAMLLDALHGPGRAVAAE